MYYIYVYVCMYIRVIRIYIYIYTLSHNNNPALQNRWKRERARDLALPSAAQSL